MSRLETIEHQVQQLNDDERKAVRAWFAEFDADAWDRQIEADARAGKLDRLAQQALADHQAGLSRPL
jgi:hypothetical protein